MAFANRSINMAQHENTFGISVALAGTDTETQLQITHNDETFSTTVNGQQVSLINNGDNAWSIVTGDLEQEDANMIGEAIEQYYQHQSL